MHFPRWKQVETAVVHFKIQRYPRVHPQVELIHQGQNGREIVPKLVKTVLTTL
jgi:hypothetical protein